MDFAAAQPFYSVQDPSSWNGAPTVKLGLPTSNCPKLSNVSQACLLVVDSIKLTIVAVTESDRNCGCEILKIEPIEETRCPLLLPWQAPLRRFKFYSVESLYRHWKAAVRTHSADI